MEIDAERQQQAREYARKRRRISYTDMAIAAAGIILILGWQPHPGWYPLQILVYFLILMIGYQLITVPLGYYGYTLSRRYGLSTMKLKGWISDLLKGFVLGLVFEGVVIMLIYALLAYQPQWWWLWVAIVLLFFSVIMANLAPVLIFPLFYKFTPLPEGELTERLMALVARANTKVRGVFSMHLSNKTTAANAALMGLGNTRRIVLGDTMTDRYSVDEIEVVLAHELGHHVHHDIWKLLLSQSVLMLGGLFVANMVLHWAVETLHLYSSLPDPATLPFLFLLMGLFGLIVMPISNGYSRSVECQADEYALQSTHKV